MQILTAEWLGLQRGDDDNADEDIKHTHKHTQALLPNEFPQFNARG